MMEFQQQRCEKCHEMLTKTKLTNEQDPYCQHCGHVFGTSVQPAAWTCEECGDIKLDLQCHDDRPWCPRCDIPMSCLSAQPSRIHGAGTGDEDLDYGLAFLYEAQGADLELGADILRDSQS